MCASCPFVQNPMAVDDDLPPGYKFRPDKEQLLVHYLRPKLDGEDFAQELVPFCDLYGKKEPWQIWNDYFQELSAKHKERTDLYFFTQLKTKTPKGKHIKRTVGSGTWKGEDAPKEVLAASQRVIGKRRRFRYENDKDSTQNDRWLMHEFELDASLLRNKQDQEDEMSCDGGDDQQDRDLPEPDEFVEEETSCTTTLKSDEHTQKAAVESEVYLQQQIAGQAMEKNDHQGSQESDVVRKWAIESQVFPMKQNARNQDHKNSETVSLEEMENFLMSDD
ncbi:hypothetical protein ACLB2K_037756 [Fragaria x ananassa]